MRINHNLLYVVAGVMSRVLSGTSLCRNRRWLSTCTGYAESIFITMFILRLTSRMFHEWISLFLPSSWVTHMHLRRAKNFLIPIIEKRMNALHSFDAEKNLDFLQYMIENAKNDECQSELLAHLELMVNVGGIHTSSMAITNAILDLCEHPEYITMLREEIQHALQDDGWQRNTDSKLHKMDSFLKESQRFSPLALCGFIFKADCIDTISDDTSILQSSCTYFVDPLLRAGNSRWHTSRCSI